jgi:soluble lytic murein transglycosylase-like protein
MNKATRYITAIILAVLLLFTLSAISYASGTTSSTSPLSPSSSPSSSPSPSPSPTASPPASPDTVKWARGHERAAKKANRRLTFARSCFLMKPLVPRYCAPLRSADDASWNNYGRSMKRAARGCVVRYNKLFYKANNPGGSSNGVRWMPLARFAGWPESTLSTLAAIIMRESSGIESNMNHQGSGAAGLLQLMPGWYHGDYYNFPDFNPLDPYLNLYYGHRGWHVSGWGPWAC